MLFSTLLVALLSLALSHADSGEVMGCGGFVQSSKSNIDLSRIQIGFYEKRNNVLRFVYISISFCTYFIMTIFGGFTEKLNRRIVPQTTDIISFPYRLMIVVFISSKLCRHVAGKLNLKNSNCKLMAKRMNVQCIKI